MKENKSCLPDGEQAYQISESFFEALPGVMFHWAMKIGDAEISVFRKRTIVPILDRMPGELEAVQAMLRAIEEQMERHDASTFIPGPIIELNVGDYYWCNNQAFVHGRNDSMHLDDI